MFFIEEPIRTNADDGPPRLVCRTDASGVHVVVPHLPAGGGDDVMTLRTLCGDLLRERGVERPIHWLYSPQFLPLCHDLEASAIVYDCMDELSAFRGAPPELRQREADLLRVADVVLTGGASLFEAKRDRHPNVHCFPSSVDFAHFARARSGQPPPADQADVPRPRMGFHGVIDERMDLELIDGIAALLPEWHLVLVGPTAKIDPVSLPRRPNIHYLGMKSYDELPRYLAGWDVAMMPFALNESTRFISPTKTPEYMAGGLPVISTAIKDVVRPYGERGLVHIASDAAGFAAAIKQIQREDPRQRTASHDAFLANMSWDATFARIEEVVERARGSDTAVPARRMAAPSAAQSESA